MQSNIHEAKTHLSSLIERALNGERVVIAKNGQPQVELKPIVEKKRKKGKNHPFFGCMKGKIEILPGFDNPIMDWDEWSKQYPLIKD